MRDLFAYLKNISTSQTPELLNLDDLERIIYGYT